MQLASGLTLSPRDIVELFVYGEKSVPAKFTAWLHSASLDNLDAALAAMASSPATVQSSFWDAFATLPELSEKAVEILTRYGVSLAHRSLATSPPELVKALVDLKKPEKTGKWMDDLNNNKKYEQEAIRLTKALVSLAGVTDKDLAQVYKKHYKIPAVQKRLIAHPSGGQELVVAMLRNHQSRNAVLRTAHLATILYTSKSLISSYYKYPHRYLFFALILPTPLPPEPIRLNERILTVLEWGEENLAGSERTGFVKQVITTIAPSLAKAPTSSELLSSPVIAKLQALVDSTDLSSEQKANMRRLFFAYLSQRQQIQTLAH